METQILTLTDEHISLAAGALQRGELVGMPTETVYGLSANPFCEEAIKKVFEVKGRAADNPLIVHIHTLDLLGQFVEDPPPLTYRLAKRFWPGPLTMILPKKKELPDIVTASLPTVAVRFPAHIGAQKLIACAGFGLAAPSANLSGRPSPTKAIHVYQDLCGKIPYILDGGECEWGLESTVIKLQNNSVTVLRPGAITVSMLQEVCDTKLGYGVLQPVSSEKKVESPGMKYRHYAPKAQVILIRGTEDAFYSYLKGSLRPQDVVFTIGRGTDISPGKPLAFGDTARERAHRLFDLLRKADEMEAKTVYIPCPSQDGLELALLNRLLRASAFRVIDLVKE